VSQGSVDIERFAGDFILLVGRHGAESAHVVQSVGHFDEHHAYILAHGQQQLAEILGLGRGLVAEDAARNLCQTLHQLGYLFAEVHLDVLHGVVGVLHYIVEQRRADRGGAKAYLLAGDFRHRYGVEDIRLAAAAADTLVSRFGKPVGPLDYLHLLAVVGGQIAVEHLAKRRIDTELLLLGGEFR
jgi:acanthoscurrin-2